jgi:hypothetical protein
MTRELGNAADRGCGFRGCYFAIRNLTWQRKTLHFGFLGRGDKCALLLAPLA